MRSWREVALPTLPGQPPTLQLWDTASLAPKQLAEGDTATIYACGITPYDAAHLGHALTFVVFDTLIRVLRDAGRTVNYVQNVTDVDEPLFERAARDGVDWRELGNEQIQLFRDDMAALRVIPPTAFVGAMEAMPEIASLLGRLEAGVYPVGNDWYADIAGSPRLGALSHLPHEEMVAISAERGGDPARAGKRDPVDPIVWRGPVPGEPSWDSPRGPGRPGWHIECAAIALKHLGPQIDIQGGGIDLVFPHQEFSSLHAEAATGLAPFASVNVHVEHLAYAGAKMSKSLGNLVFVGKLLAGGTEPAAIRLALQSVHHRSGWEWTPASLEDAQQRLEEWRLAVDRARQLGGGASGATVLRAVRTALADDLDTPAALRAVDAWAAKTSQGAGGDPGAADTVVALADALLGVLL